MNNPGIISTSSARKAVLTRKAFELVRLGEEDVKAKFPAMYNAFCYGAPPHAGIAPGVDRMVMLLAGEDSIREIIPFPMNKNAQDLMMGAPGEVTQKQLDELFDDMGFEAVFIGSGAGLPRFMGCLLYTSRCV